MTNGSGKMVENSSKVGMIEGFKIREEGPVVNHFQFVDNPLIFCKDSHKKIRMVQCILRCFEVVIGIRVNFVKSVMFGIGEGVDSVELARSLGCRVGYLLASYLGLPLGARHWIMEVWNWC